MFGKVTLSKAYKDYLNGSTSIVVYMASDKTCYKFTRDYIYRMTFNPNQKEWSYRDTYLLPDKLKPEDLNRLVTPCIKPIKRTNKGFAV